MHPVQSEGGTIGKRLVLVGVVVAGLGLRLAYLLQSHPFFDEYATILAARMVLRSGLPVLPSGLFYEHGLLFTYLDAPFVALAGWLGDGGGPILFVAARLPSLLIGVVAVALLFCVTARWLSARAGLVASTLLALSPEGVVWGGRARMYALAQLLALAMAFLVYQGSLGRGSARLRWLALLVLLASLLTQFGAIILVPPLVVAALVIGWLTCPAGEKPWFARPEALFQGVALLSVLGLGVLVKRLGQPLGVAPLGSPGAEDVGRELLTTITYQVGPVLDVGGLIKFLAREFGVPHHLWLTVVVVFTGLLALAGWFWQPDRRRSSLRVDSRPRQPFVTLYLWIVVAMPVLEMVTLLEPWRRNTRYLVMVLPWFYLLVAAGLEGVLSQRWARFGLGWQRVSLRVLRWLAVAAVAAMHARGLWIDLQVAFRTPEPAYEQAFRHVADAWQDGDVVLTMNTSAAGLLLGRADYFAAQEDAGQFLLASPSPGRDEVKPVDRWMGAPWLGTAAGFNRALNEHPRAWFVVDSIRLPVYYRGDWLSVLKTQMDQVWSGDEALVFLTRQGRRPLPTAPTVEVHALLGDTIRFMGFDCDADAARKPGDTYALTLFWATSSLVTADYTVFVHLRDSNGITVAQQDARPLAGDYPTSQWRPDEMVIDPHPMALPDSLLPGEYAVWVGMYRLDTLERLPVAGDASGENAIRLGSVMVQ